jgi:hypothetical protein
LRGGCAPARTRGDPRGALRMDLLSVRMDLGDNRTI